MTTNIYPLMISEYESELDELMAEDAAAQDERLAAATAGLADILADLGLED